MINGETKIFGLIGSNIKKTLSPMLHNQAFDEMNMNCIYVPLQVDKKEDLLNAIHGIRSLNFIGVNVTMPYKEVICNYVDILHGCAKEILSVNTLVVDKNKQIIGYNTDGAGFINTLDNAGVQYKNKSILIFGTGGASKAIAWELKKEKADRIIMLTRKNSGKISKFFEIYEWHAKEAEAVFAQADIIVNATPVGMVGYEECLFPIPWKNMKKNAVCYDIVYNPTDVSFAIQARKRGFEVFAGKEMLIEQARLSRKIWLKYL